jgi:hypothetical protein
VSRRLGDSGFTVGEGQSCALVRLFKVEGLATLTADDRLRLPRGRAPGGALVIEVAEAERRAGGTFDQLAGACGPHLGDAGTGRPGPEGRPCLTAGAAIEVARTS